MLQTDTRFFKEGSILNGKKLIKFYFSVNMYYKKMHICKLGKVFSVNLVLLSSVSINREF